jgi:hypothetical protein
MTAEQLSTTIATHSQNDKCIRPLSPLTGGWLTSAEIIVVADGGTDESRSRLEELVHAPEAGARLGAADS